MRTAGVGGASVRLPAFWTGLLYDATALDAAWDLVKAWTAQERHALRNDVPKGGLQAPFRGGAVLDVARGALAIAQDGLKRRGLTQWRGTGRKHLLEPLAAI